MKGLALWQQMTHWQVTPLYQWLMRYRFSTQPIPTLWFLWGLASGMVLFFAIVAQFGIEGFITILVVVGVVIPALLLIAHGTVFGAYWSVNIAREMGKFQRNTMGDLLNVTALPVSWRWIFLCARVNRSSVTHTLHRIVRTVTFGLEGFLLVSVGLIVLNALLSPVGWRTFWGTMGGVVPLMMALAVLYLDHIYSLVIGGVLGIYTTIRIQDALMRPVGALLLFLQIQLISYVFIVFCWLLMRASLLASVDLFIRDLLASVLFLVIYVVVREGIVRALWGLFQRESW